MKLKQKVGDFRVRELLERDYLQPSGEFRVYRVTKSKLTSPDAAAQLAQEAGVDAGAVSMAGLKDRQAVTVQHMSVRGGREVRSKRPGLRIEPVGFAGEELASRHTQGNAFEIAVRALDRSQLATLRGALDKVRQGGVPNYFDDQRFGNLRHDQGWIAAELMRGRHELALRTLLAGISFHDDKRTKRSKAALERVWGDWPACLDAARRWGRHHSVFEHLQRNPDDFAGAFTYISSRLRLIHLYAWQSHIWNRAVAQLLRERLPLEQRLVVDSEEGPLICHGAGPPAGLDEHSRFPLPGPRLAGVEDPGDRAIFERVLEQEGFTPEEFDIQGIPGFQLKPEGRALIVVPRHLRVRPPAPDSLNPGLEQLVLRFELPRGAYATLVAKRLLATRLSSERERGESREGGRGPAGGRPGRPHGRGGDDRGGRGGYDRGGRGGDDRGGRGGYDRGGRGGYDRGARGGDDRGGRGGDDRGARGGDDRGGRGGDDRGGRGGDDRGGRGGDDRGGRGGTDRGGRGGTDRGGRGGTDRGGRGGYDRGGRGGDNRGGGGGSDRSRSGRGGQRGGGPRR